MAPVSWQAEVYDTDGFADLVGQPTRLTVPASKGITSVQLLCRAQGEANATGHRAHNA